MFFFNCLPRKQIIFKSGKKQDYFEDSFEAAINRRAPCNIEVRNGSSFSSISANSSFEYINGSIGKSVKSSTFLIRSTNRSRKSSIMRISISLPSCNRPVINDPNTYTDEIAYSAFNRSTNRSSSGRMVSRCLISMLHNLCIFRHRPP